MEMDYPKTRMDNFFAKAAGSELADNSMEPITDREYWINELAARLAEGGLVPPIEEGDDGKVLTVDEGAAVWAEGGGGSSDPYDGYDFVWKFDNYDLAHLNTNEIHLVKGSFESASSKGAQRLPLTALSYCTNDDSYPEPVITTFRTDHVHYDAYVPPDADPFIEFRFYNTRDSVSILFFYYPDGRIEID